MHYLVGKVIEGGSSDRGDLEIKWIRKVEQLFVLKFNFDLNMSFVCYTRRGRLFEFILYLQNE